MGVSVEVLPVVNAVILEKTSFFVIVGDEHGLTEGVLLAEIVLVLEEKQTSRRDDREILKSSYLTFE